MTDEQRRHQRDSTTSSGSSTRHRHRGTSSSGRSARAAGFSRWRSPMPWTDVPTAGFVVRAQRWSPGGCRGAAAPPVPHRRGHTDSPGLRIKPNPDAEAFGWEQLGVEVYGGILNNSWLDRTSDRGRLVAADGPPPVNVPHLAPGPQLAVHLDREVNTRLCSTAAAPRPCGASAPPAGEFAQWAAEAAGHRRSTGVVGLSACSTCTALRCSVPTVRCWPPDASTTRCRAGRGRALLRAAPATRSPSSRRSITKRSARREQSGAAGPFLENVLSRLVSSRGGTVFHRAIADSACVSADNAHAVHPNYPDATSRSSTDRQRWSGDQGDLESALRHLGHHGIGVPVLANGPTSRGRSSCREQHAVWIDYRTDHGDTLGIETVDVGVPQLSMHSACELCGTARSALPRRRPARTSCRTRLSDVASAAMSKQRAASSA